MTATRFLAGLFVLLALGGCELLQPVSQTSRVPVTSVTDAGDPDWLREIDRVLALPAERQPEVLEERQQAYMARPSTETRLRLALLRALGAEAVRDRESALALLTEIEPLQTTGPEASLIALLRRLLEGQEELADRLQQERRALAARETRIRELETQLEAVTSIEQSIKQRQKALQGVKP